MGGGVPKQFRDFGGRPLLMATLEAFLQPGMPALAGISLAVPPDRMDEAKRWDLGVRTWIVEGGPSRQASVLAALSALPDEPGSTVLIHDAVRPFPPAVPIMAAIRALGAWDGALLGEASTDTLKRVDHQGQVLETVPREAIFRAQTPQAARLGTWRRAFAWAAETGFEATDDVALLEALGLRVLMVPSPGSNLKITTAEDWNQATECGR
ncbi:MAG: 2-C-methyl-D-erythritol 4-phosphate cytidylyltransferase [Holophagaceae bacterium]|nr:2-C-methyl-D-erythritol 4-phosphate cytidylyltransferase [Holophagaceae bacterium]